MFNSSVNEKFILEDGVKILESLSEVLDRKGDSVESLLTDWQINFSGLGSLERKQNNGKK